MRTPKNILLVEDEPTLQRILGSVLTDAGHRVDSVGTAEQALERLQNPGAPDVDLVLSDKNLPATGGLELLTQVRALEKKIKRLVAFILVTGYPSRESAIAVLDNEGDGYLVKPFRSLSHAVDQIQAILDSDLAQRRGGAPDAKALAQLLAGAADQPSSAAHAGVSAAVLVDDPALARRIRRALERGGARVVAGVKELPAAGRVAVVAARAEDLVAFAKSRRGAALLLLDSGVPFQDIVSLIVAGSAAIVDPQALPPAAADDKESV